MKIILFLSFISLSLGHFNANTTAPLPIVIWHGMGDCCCNPMSMGYVKDLLEKHIPGDVYVHSLEIGDSITQDIENGFFMPVNDQVKLVCDKIAADPKLKGGFNALGFSQGGQFLRAVAQRCPQLGMKNLISFGAQYWHDPLDEKLYREKSLFIAEINNEREPRNASYAENLNRLENFVLVEFADDTVVDPKASEWFGFYTPGQAVEILPLRQSDIYKEDRIGLRKMDREGKLKFLSSPGNHLQFTEDFLVKEIVRPYLL